jgi:hypothetical protein
MSPSIRNQQGRAIVSQNDLANYWLTQIINENSKKMSTLPSFIVHQQFSHVRVLAAGTPPQTVPKLSTEKK